ncbi:hypothetical protein KAT63_03215 [Candidatus Parcubacteria bacterium]|nr:hypothetical protein [Candidatus Parcubacteria bacterium]
MKNGAKIRTMSDDLKDIKSDSTKQDEQQKSVSETAAKKIQQPSVQLNSTQPAKPNTLQAVRSDMQQQPAEPDDKQSEIKEKTVPESLNNDSNKPLIKPISDQDNKLKELIKKISDQTDKDSDDKYKTEKKEEVTAISQLERKDVTAKETEIVDELAGKNKNESEIKKEDISKEIANEPVKKEVDDKNTDDIDKLKKLIHRISEPKSSIEEKPENKTVDLENTKEKNTASGTASPLVQKPKQNIQQNQTIKKPKKPFWGNISEKLKKTSDSEKINALSSKKKISDIMENDDSKTKELASRSGILQDNKDAEQKEASQKENLSKKAYYDKNYVSPNERLIHGKQKFYSSVSKRIKLREEKDELKDLEDAAKMKKQKKIATKEEEYKELKKSIIQKYHIKLFSLPWKKIIFIAGIVFILTGSALYFVSKIKPPAPPAPPAIVTGIELEEFSNLEKEIIIEKNGLKGNDTWLKIKAEEIFDSSTNIKIIKLIIIDNNTNKNILTLEEALDTIGIINIEDNINYLPKNFLEISTNNYNLFMFQANKNSLRYGLAIKVNNADSMSVIMESWEQEGAKNKKMTSVLKPLFIDDKNFEDVFVPLSATRYRNVEIKYVSLIDKETALDYFIYNDILVFATSKDSAFMMVDLLTSNE